MKLCWSRVKNEVVAEDEEDVEDGNEALKCVMSLSLLGFTSCTFSSSSSSIIIVLDVVIVVDIAWIIVSYDEVCVVCANRHK